ncbi:MAG: phosphatidylglycerophosphatase A [Acidocella sp.]|nr:phosphatidylglycerophosphatase A [Acidocella sp.]
MNTAELIASAGGAGYAPKAPGTFGSLIGLLIGAILLQLGHGPLVMGIIVASIIGVWAVWAVGGQNDPGWIVIDEVAGQMITMLALPRVSALGCLLAFGLFRLFDIWKPGPVGLADRRHDALGVMADDWIAGMIGFACLAVLAWLLPGHWL